MGSHFYSIRKSHLINRGLITQPKRYGGLGNRKCHKANLAFFMSTVWCNPSSLWAKMIFGKLINDRIKALLGNLFYELEMRFLNMLGGL